MITVSSAAWVLTTLFEKGRGEHPSYRLHFALWVDSVLLNLFESNQYLVNLQSTI
jgi:hypothetical protein